MNKYQQYIDAYSKDKSDVVACYGVLAYYEEIGDTEHAEAMRKWIETLKDRETPKSNPLEMVKENTSGMINGWWGEIRRISLL